MAFPSHSQTKSTYNYKTISELVKQERVNVFGVIHSGINSSVESVSHIYYAVIEIKDETCKHGKTFKVYIIYDKNMSGLRIKEGAVIRIHDMTIDCFSDEFFGHVFSIKNIVTFVPKGDGSLDMFSTVKVCTLTDEDENRVNDLINWNRSQSISNINTCDIVLKDITKEGNYNLVCEVVSCSKLSENKAILTVTNETKCLPTMIETFEASDTSCDGSFAIDILITNLTEELASLKKGQIVKINNISVNKFRTAETEKDADSLLKLHLNGKEVTVCLLSNKKNITRHVVKKLKDLDIQDSPLEISSSLKELLEKPAWLSLFSDSDFETERQMHVPVRTKKVETPETQAHSSLIGNTLKKLDRYGRLCEFSDSLSLGSQDNYKVLVPSLKQHSTISQAVVSDIQESDETRVGVQLIPHSTDQEIKTVNQKEGLYTHLCSVFSIEDNTKVTQQNALASPVNKIPTQLSETEDENIIQDTQNTVEDRVELQVYPTHSNEISTVQQKEDLYLHYCSAVSNNTKIQPDGNADATLIDMPRKRRCIVLKQVVENDTQESVGSKIEVQPHYYAADNTEVEIEWKQDVLKQFCSPAIMNDSGEMNIHQLRNMDTTSIQTANINHLSLSVISSKSQTSEGGPSTHSTISSATCTIPSEYTSLSVLEELQKFYKVHATIINIDPPLTNPKVDFVSGSCSNCEKTIVYSKIITKMEDKAVCGSCWESGTTIYLKLNFALQLELMDQENQYLTVNASGKNCEILLGCTAADYLENLHLQCEVHRVLTYIMSASQRRYIDIYLSQDTSSSNTTFEISNTTLVNYMKLVRDNKI